MSGYTSGPVREGAQAHIRALKAEDYVTDLLDEAQKRYGKVIFAYRRGSEFNISTDYGKGLFELLSEAYLDNVLLIVSGNPILGETLARELLGGLGALSPREATTSSRSSQRTGGTTQRSSKVFDFGPLNPPMTKTHVNKVRPKPFSCFKSGCDQISSIPHFFLRLRGSPKVDVQPHDTAESDKERYQRTAIAPSTACNGCEDSRGGSHTYRPCSIEPPFGAIFNAFSVSFDR